MTKPIDDDIDDFDEPLSIDDDDDNIDSDESESSSVDQAPLIRDYSDRRVLVWEEDDERCSITVEVLSDLLVGAYVKGVNTESEALALLDSDEWDTFVVDFYTEGVSVSEFIKRVNNYPDSILVAISMTPLKLQEEREPAKLETLRRLFDFEKNSIAPIRG